MEQSTTISKVMGSILSKNESSAKRLNNLESSEYCHLNFYGSMYQQGLATVIAVASAGVYYPITAMLTGLVKGFTFAASVLTCTKAGVYKCEYAVSINGMVNNNTATAITVNNVVLPQTVSDVLTTAANGHQFLSNAGITRLVVGDQVRVAIANLTDADDPTIDNASVVLTRVGD